MKYLIAGLGNIGKEYELTKHNIGFFVLDCVAKAKKVKFKLEKRAFITEFKHHKHTLYLIKPTTYMNLSGKSVNFYLQKYKISKENLLVITDDIALPLGKIRLKPKGSSGGHNGLKNIEQLTGGKNFARLRFGIGNEFLKGKQSDYVLTPFSKQEFEEVLSAVDKATEALFSFVTTGITQTMNQYN